MSDKPDIDAMLNELGIKDPAFSSMMASVFERVKQDEALWDEMVAQANGGPASPYVAPPPYQPDPTVPSGENTCEPFAILHIDEADWPYNSLYICTDASILHRLQNDTSTPGGELVQEVLYDGDFGQAGYQRAVGVKIDASSQGDWWAKANRAMDDAEIPEDLRFEGSAF